MIPYYWVYGNVKNDEVVRLRMKDALATVTLEETMGNNFAEWAYTPHLFSYNRARNLSGYMHPDDPRTMHMNSFNRKNKYKEI